MASGGLKKSGRVAEAELRTLNLNREQVSLLALDRQEWGKLVDALCMRRLATEGLMAQMS